MLLTTAALPALWAAPANAKDAEAAPAAPTTTAAEPTPDLTMVTIATPNTDDRLMAMAAAGEGSGRSRGLIRPFGGDILPNAGMIRGFAGPITGSAGMIRGFAGDVTATAGMIRGFAGDATASAGMIRGFAGMIRGFSGDLRASQAGTLTSSGPDAAFWGDLDPASGTLKANAGMIRGFSGDFTAMAGMIRGFSDSMRTADGQLLTWESGAATYTGLNERIAEMVAGAKTTWGGAVTTQTGKSFEDGFSDKMLQKYGIDLRDPKSLVGMDEFGMEVFLLDYYDNLMQFSGADQVDHWMKAVNWNPRITQDLGSGKGSRIGLLDFTVTGEGISSLVQAAGKSTVAGTHGSAVLSLMTAAHDGRGVMGIAPGASVVSFNPFDDSYTAGWTDIKDGVQSLVENGATIINMSLGVPNWTLNAGWNDVFSNSLVQSAAKSRVFVLAAGNDGITQTEHVKWAFDKNPTIIVVGSVDPKGVISEFSNRPGTACLTQDGKVGWGCNDSTHQKLASRFIVAPGEWMLVADGAGGVTRMSGTSFAAPLVSGTVALIHDRWPWLSTKPKDTAELILGSARDIGAAGTDAVYGRGMLDVAAALSPKSLGSLYYKLSVNGNALKSVEARWLSAAQRESTIAFWEANKAYVYAFDDTLSSYRDFAIPLSSKLAGMTFGSSQEQFQSYLTSRFLSWFRSGGTVTSGKGDDDDDDDDFRSSFGAASHVARLAAPDGFTMTMSAAPKPYRPGFRQDGVPYETGFALRDTDGGYQLRFGTGRGGAALGQSGFGMQSDYDVATGGANPFLGLASGAGYAAVDVDLARGLTVTTGTARQDARRDLRGWGAEARAGLGSLDPYRANATTVSLRYAAAPWLTTTVGYTLLDEKSGLLGTQSLDRNDFARGSRSDAGTAAVDLALSPSLSVSGSATWGRTRAGDTARQSIAVSSGGLLSSAYQAAVTKVGLFGDDRMRVTFAQPLHLERGSIDVANVQVIDRATGELGTVVQTFQLQSKQRRYLAEMLYGRSLGNGAELNLFGRANLGGTRNSGEAAVTLGSSLRLGF